MEDQERSARKSVKDNIKMFQQGIETNKIERENEQRRMSAFVDPIQNNMQVNLVMMMRTVVTMRRQMLINLTRSMLLL